MCTMLIDFFSTHPERELVELINCHRETATKDSPRVEVETHALEHTVVRVFEVRHAHFLVPDVSCFELGFHRLPPS